MIQLPLERLYLSGVRHLTLIEDSITFLTKLDDALSGEEFKQLVTNILPSMKSFLQLSQREGADDLSSDNPIKSKRKKKRKMMDNQETECERVQKKMLLFLGNLEMESLVNLLQSKEELGLKVYF